MKDLRIETKQCCKF